MDARELRLGNLIQDLDGNILTIDSIGSEGVGYWCNDIFGWEDLCICKPIPITEELLLKAGFELQYFGTIKTDAYKNKIVTIHCIGGNTGEFQVAIFNKIFPIYIQYIHQLQNLIYSLTGSELTFKQ